MEGSSATGQVNGQRALKYDTRHLWRKLRWKFTWDSIPKLFSGHQGLSCDRFRPPGDLQTRCAVSTQQTNPDSPFTYSAALRDLPCWNSSDLLFHQGAVRGAADAKNSRNVNRSQIQCGHGSGLVFNALHRPISTNQAAVKIQRNRINPRQQQRRVAKLRQSLPATDPCGLSDLLGALRSHSSRP